MNISKSYFDNMKSLFESKTFWLALGQAAIGVIAIFATTYPDAHWAGSLLLVKSIIDVWLRTQTTTSIGSILPQG